MLSIACLFWQIRSLHVKFMKLLDVLMEDLEPLLQFQYIIWFVSQAQDLLLDLEDRIIMIHWNVTFSLDSWYFGVLRLWNIDWRKYFL